MSRCARICFSIFLFAISFSFAYAEESQRVEKGLFALYDFSDPDAKQIANRVEANKLPLNIDRDNAKVTSDDQLQLDKALVKSATPATELIKAIQSRGELTIEVWLTPADTKQSGPARIVTLSADTGQRNFTLGQDGDKFDVRLRTDKTSENGIPSLSSPAKSVAAKQLHVVYTRSKNGAAQIFVDGKEVAKGNVAGSLKNWNETYHLALGNELTGDRPWNGTLHLVAIYERALTSEEVMQNFRAGPKTASSNKSNEVASIPMTPTKPEPPKPQPEEKPDEKLAAEQFEKQIAPLLSGRCLQCHDSAIKKGGLDLSSRESALAGGESGAAIVPGKWAESLLWHSVADNEMPKNGPPLSERDKQQIKTWIETGAVWTIARLEPSSGKDGYDKVAKQEDWVRRLTVTEYINTVRDAIGVDVERDARRLLPADVRADGFTNTAYNLNVDLGHVDGYATLAEVIVSRVDLPKFTARFSAKQSTEPAAIRELVANMGRWVLRGPLTEAEIDSFASIGAAVKKEGGDFQESAAFILEAMLQSPRFIYRIEDSTKSGAVSDYELASRLSYTLWGGPPDESLYADAAAGRLAGPENADHLERQVQRLLADPRAKTRSVDFVAQWLDLDRLRNLRPNPKQFPDFDLSLTEDMRAETEAYFEEVAWKQKRPLADLFNAQVTIISQRLARHYGLDQSEPLPFDDPKIAAALEARFLFDATEGNVVKDVSGKSPPLNLTIANPANTEWQSGGLVIKRPTILTADRAASKRLTAAIQKSQELTIVAWLTPANATQEGPARIVTLSSGTSNRNFTLGQERRSYHTRFRTSNTDRNGMPPTASRDNVFSTGATKIVYSRTAKGKGRIYINGELVGEQEVSGSLDNWDADYIFALANETSQDRAWLGTFERVEVYSKAVVAAADQRPSGPQRLDLTAIPSRGGLLTQGSVLTLGGDNASMVSRGLFVLHDVLRGEVSDPPPCVDTTPVPARAGLSQRGIAEGRVANQACGGCHSRFEPLAFGLERFDGLGSYQEKDAHGNQLREDGQLIIPGEEKPLDYKTSAELMDLLAGSERVQKTLTWKLAQFALGRPIAPADAPLLEDIHSRSMTHGGTYQSTMSAIVTSDLIGRRQPKEHPQVDQQKQAPPTQKDP